MMVNEAVLALPPERPIAYVATIIGPAMVIELSATAVTAVDSSER